MPQESRVPLPDLYEAAVEEDRFQVGLNWDRTKFFVLLNASILAAAVGLLQLSSSPTAAVLVVLVFVAGVIVAFHGIRAIESGKVYHRAAVARKALLEEALGLAQGVPNRQGEHATFAVGATPRSKTARILEDPDTYVSPTIRQRSITGGIVSLLAFLLMLHALGAVLVLVAALLCLFPDAPCVLAGA